jgi:exodeoxyribonuclease V alpha subunit
VCWPEPDGTARVWFEQDGRLRAWSPGQLPQHDTAFATTVHKAQGSEFDDIWLLLPARDSRVLSRELVYTGITRARRALHLAGNAEVIASALARKAGRWSGLGWRLGSKPTRATSP